MSVNIYRSEEDESIVNNIYITEESDENIDMSEFANIKQIRTLKFENITDLKKIQEILNKIPLHLIEKLEISNCDFKDMDLGFFSKLENLNEIEIKLCTNIDYNEVIKRIPNKNLLKVINLLNNQENTSTLDVKILAEFQKLEVIRLGNFARLDMKTLQSVLSSAENISKLMFIGHIQSLDFISGIDIEHIDIMDYNLDLSLITPEIAKAHRKISFNVAIITEKTEDGQGYKLTLPLSRIIKTKESKEIKELKENATNIEICEAINISNEEKLQEIIENKESLSKVTRIQHLNIKGIQDSKKIQQLLESIPLEVIEELEIRDCNMQGVESAVFKRLHKIKKVLLFRNKGIDYNEILECIPNKENVENIMFETEENNVKCGNIQKYTGVKMITLDGFQALDEGEIEEILLRAENLKWFRGSVDFKSLDFLAIENELVRIDLNTGDFDKKAITPEIAKAHKTIGILTPEGKIVTTKQEDGENYELEFDLNLYKDIEQLKELKEGAIKWNFISCEVDIYGEEDINRLVAYKEIISQAEGFYVKVSHIGILKPSDIQRLDEEFENLDGIIITDPEEGHNIQRQEYTVDEYKELQKKVKEITGDIPSNLTELQKFMIIYKRLGEMISYDYEMIREDKDRDQEYIKQNMHKSRNLLNGLMRGKCVCAGYADILYNCLSVVGIETCKISGKQHAWNKVKIDGVWYNVDLTWDRTDTAQHNARGLKYCLRSDEEFKDEHHTQREGKKVESRSDYPREEIVKAFRFAEEFDRVKDAEYEVIAEEPSFFEKLKARAMILFGKRKMIAEPEQEGTTESDKRRKWETISGIKVTENSQAVQEQGIDNKVVVTTKHTENPHEHEELGN